MLPYYQFFISGQTLLSSPLWFVAKQAVSGGSAAQAMAGESDVQTIAGDYAAFFFAGNFVQCGYSGGPTGQGVWFEL